MNSVIAHDWIREISGWWCLLGIVVVVIDWTRRIIFAPRAFVKYVAKLARYQLALAVVIGIVFGTWVAFAGMGHWWEGFSVGLLGCAGIGIWFGLMMAPMFIGFEWWDRLMKRRKEKSASSEQNTL